MAIKVRLFLDGKQVDPKALTISNVTVNRTVNSVIERLDAKRTGNNKPNQVA